VIVDYANLVDRFPGTPAAKEAAERKSFLEAKLRDVKANKKFELVELSEIAHYRKTVDQFQPRKPDLSEIDATITGVPDARARRGHEGDRGGAVRGGAGVVHRKWKAALEQRGTITSRSSEGRRRDEVEAVPRRGEAVERLPRGHAEGGDRLLSVGEGPVPVAAVRRSAALALKKVAFEARAAWPAQEADADQLAKDKSYKGAIELLDTVILTSVDEIAQLAEDEAGQPGERVGLASSARRTRTARRPGPRRWPRLGVAFAQEAQAARVLVLKYDFKGALDEAEAAARRQHVGGAPAARRAPRRRDGAVRPLQGEPPQGHQGQDDLGIQGRLHRVGARGDRSKRRTTRSLHVRLDAGGEVDRHWTEFDPPALVKFVMDQWKYKKEQRRDITDQNDLAAVLHGVRLYEKALEAIQGASDLMQDPVAQIPPSAKAVRRGVSRPHPPRRVGEYSEIEAKKRIEPPAERSSATRSTGGAGGARHPPRPLLEDERGAEPAADAQDLEKKISKEGGESFNTAMKADRLKAIQAKLADDQAAARKAQWTSSSA
jgi:hypothetical protein